MAMYDDFAKTFSESRKNMKWWEIDYFLDFLRAKKTPSSLLDIWCGNGRLLEIINDSDIKLWDYLWADNSLWLLEEAKNLHPDNRFELIDMHDIWSIKQKYDFIFFIASFHHLESVEERENVLLSAYNLLNKGWKLCMTNWALESDINKEKYARSREEWSENIFWSSDYNIKIWVFIRYYHCFTLKELENISTCAWFQIVENRLFENQKNFITILKK